MLDPEIYAVGTKHKSISQTHEYIVLARDIKTPEYKSGLCMLMYEINPDDCEQATHTVDQLTGRAFDTDSLCAELDLVITQPTIKGWINIYKGNILSHTIKPTREDADNERSADCIACIEVEFTKGQGL